MASGSTRASYVGPCGPSIRRLAVPFSTRAAVGAEHPVGSAPDNGWTVDRRALLKQMAAVGVAVPARLGPGRFDRQVVLPAPDRLHRNLPTP